VRAWFNAQPIHRKLVLTSMVKTTVVLFVAMVLLLVLDSLRFQAGAKTDAQSLAAIMAENIRAAMAFRDEPAITETLSTLRLRPQVQRGCAYDRAGTLVASYSLPGFPCPASPPGEPIRSAFAAIAPVVHEGAAIGHVYIGRDWLALQQRLITAGLASLAILVLAGAGMLMLSSRMHRTISEPIRQLATVAGRMGQNLEFTVPPIKVSNDEVGQLVTAFSAMANRVRAVNEDLSRSNEALRREIDERKLIQAEREAVLQREREASRIKDEFLATVSHELRTPLNAIVGWAHILVANKPDEATVAKAAASLHRNAQTQARVIDDLIDISRIVTGKLRVQTEPVDLRPVVEAAVESIRPAAEQAGITLIVTLPPSTCIINGDADRLRQVVWNLLSNAVKFARRGTVHVTVSEERRGLQLVVADNGVGIVPEFLPHVFDRFRQADSSITREQGGLGIGLSVVKELVELHGGTIRAESAGRGKGATFTVTFPCAIAQLPESAPEEVVPSLAGVSVLAVDDNLDSLEVLREVLAQAGAGARVAATGEEALDIWRRAPSDVLLCDLAMPGMSGFQLLARVRELDRVAGRVTPAIAVTAHASDEQVARSAQAGFQNHIAKPFDSAQLVRAIHAARTRV
jgi:signal transduction histidine kinase/ActR/RegA family two-component response regulator